MTKEEALERLELNEGASTSEISSRFEEVKAELEMRVNNAPTEHQQNLYKKKLAELEEVRDVLLKTETENEDLPSKAPVTPSAAVESAPAAKQPVDFAKALAILGLSSKSTQDDVRDAYESKKSELSSRASSATSDALKSAIKMEGELLDEAFSVALPLAVIPVVTPPEPVAVEPEPAPIPEPVVEEPISNVIENESEVKAVNSESVTNDNHITEEPKEGKKNKFLLYGVLGVAAVAILLYFILGTGGNEEVKVDPQEELYLSYIHEADSLIAASTNPDNILDSTFTGNHDDAWDLFTKALGVKPNDPYATSRIEYLDSLLTVEMAAKEEEENKKSKSSGNNYASNYSKNSSKSSNDYTEEVVETSNNTGSLKIGDRYMGGIIFELDASGTHGKVVQEKDNSMVYKWKNVQYGTRTLNGTEGWRVPLISEMKSVYSNLVKWGYITFSSEEYWAKYEWNVLMGNSYFMETNGVRQEDAAKTRWLRVRFVKDF